MGLDRAQNRETARPVMGASAWANSGESQSLAAASGDNGCAGGSMSRVNSSGSRNLALELRPSGNTKAFVRNMRMCSWELMQL